MVSIFDLYKPANICFHRSQPIQWHLKVDSKTVTLHGSSNRSDRSQLVPIGLCQWIVSSAWAAWPVHSLYLWSVPYWSFAWFLSVIGTVPIVCMGSTSVHYRSLAHVYPQLICTNQLVTILTGPMRDTFKFFKKSEPCIAAPLKDSDNCIHAHGDLCTLDIYVSSAIFAC